MRKIRFDIYVASLSGTAKNTCTLFESACAEILGEKKFNVKVVDIIKQSTLADDDRILAIPTIIRKYPLPMRRAIGEIADMENALKAVQFLINDL